MSYTASVLLAPSSNISLQNAEVKLLEFFSNERTQDPVNIQIRENKLVLTFNSWSLYIHLQSEPDVLEESKEMANIFGQNHPDVSVIATCTTRFVISCDPDESIDHFNDYILTLEQLSSIPGAFVFDNASQEFI